MLKLGEKRQIAVIWRDGTAARPQVIHSDAAGQGLPPPPEVGYKVRHAFGAGMADPKATVASNGSGS